MVVDIFNTDRKYQTIYADPPWWETGGGKIKRGADRHYQLMKTPEIIALPVPELIAPDGCHLYLWATNNHLAERQGWAGTVLPGNDRTLFVRNHQKETAV